MLKSDPVKAEKLFPEPNHSEANSGENSGINNSYLSYRKFTPSISFNPEDMPEDSNDPIGIIFLGGFMSDMEGSKAVFLEKFCMERNVPFIRFDYSGHGSSSGDFCEGNISQWLLDSLEIFDKISDGKQIVIGSSMGSWLMLLLALERSRRIHSLISIACAADFTEDLIWKKMSEENKEKLLAGEIVDLLGDCSPEEGEDHMPYPITKQLIDDGRNNMLLDKDVINIKCPVRLLHGMRDIDVPYEISIEVAKKIESDDVKVSLLKNSDHRMSSEECLTFLAKNIEELLAI